MYNISIFCVYWHGVHWHVSYELIAAINFLISKELLHNNKLINTHLYIN